MIFFAFGGITDCGSTSLKLCVCDAAYTWSQSPFSHSRCFDYWSTYFNCIKWVTFFDKVLVLLENGCWTCLSYNSFFVSFSCLFCNKQSCLDCNRYEGGTLAGYSAQLKFTGQQLIYKYDDVFKSYDIFKWVWQRGRLSKELALNFKGWLPTCLSA